jgi:hypothetical protein
MSVRNSGIVLTLSLLAACTTAAPPSSAQGVAVRVDPPAAVVTPGGSTRFVATVTGTALTSVDWSVQEGPGCGTVGPDGVYVAPGAPSTCHVVATTVADPAAAAVVPVTISPAFAVEPATATVDACGAQAFAATGAGAGDVAWSVEEPGGGTVADGAYVAPPGAGTYHVVASLRSDPSRTARAAVTVGPERVIAVAVDPAAATVAPGGARSFSATVRTTCGSFAAQ